MDNQPWYAQVFDDEYVRVMGYYLTEERSEREAAAIASLLDQAPGSAMLDLCCGQGRHAIPLAGRGYQMTGLDLSATLLLHAQGSADTRDLRVHWVRGDMRRLPFQGEFDGIFNVFTSFGYFEDEEEDLQVLREVHRALRPSGRFLLGGVHRDGLLGHEVPCTVDRHGDGVVVVRERQFDLPTSRHAVRFTTLYPDGRRHEFAYSFRLYTLRELIRMHVTAGFHVLAWYGSYDRSPLTLSSMALVIVSEKQG